MDASSDSDTPDLVRFIRPRLEEITVSAWRPFAVEKMPEPLREYQGFILALGPNITLEGNEDTGRVHITTHEYDLEVLGQPGGELFVPGGQDPEVEAWLRTVHSRYWEFAESLDAAVHDKLLSLLNGDEPRPAADEPHLFAPDFVFPKPEWVVPGFELHLNEARDLSSEGERSRAFNAFAVDPADGHEHIALVLITDEGHITAALNEPVRADGFHKEAMKAMLDLGSRQFAWDILHMHLHRAANLAILGDDIETLGMYGFSKFNAR